MTQQIEHITKKLESAEKSADGAVDANEAIQELKKAVVDTQVRIQNIPNLDASEKSDLQNQMKSFVLDAAFSQHSSSEALDAYNADHFDTNQEKGMSAAEFEAFMNKLNTGLDRLVRMENFDDFVDLQEDIADDIDSKSINNFADKITGGKGLGGMFAEGVTNYTTQERKELLDAKWGDDNFFEGIGLALLQEGPQIAEDLLKLVVGLMTGVGDVPQYIYYRSMDGFGFGDAQEYTLKAEALAGANPVIGLLHLITSAQGISAAKELFGKIGEPSSWTAEGIVLALTSIVGMAAGGAGAARLAGGATRLTSNIIGATGKAGRAGVEGAKAAATFTKKKADTVVGVAKNTLDTAVAPVKKVFMENDTFRAGVNGVREKAAEKRLTRSSRNIEKSIVPLLKKQERMQKRLGRIQEGIQTKTDELTGLNKRYEEAIKNDNNLMEAIDANGKTVRIAKPNSEPTQLRKKIKDVEQSIQNLEKQKRAIDGALYRANAEIKSAKGRMEDVDIRKGNKVRGLKRKRLEAHTASQQKKLDALKGDPRQFDVHGMPIPGSKAAEIGSDILAGRKVLKKMSEARVIKRIEDAADASHIMKYEKPFGINIGGKTLHIVKTKKGFEVRSESGMLGVLKGGENTLGRNSENITNDIDIPGDSKVSRMHLKIYVDNKKGTIDIQDISKNGTRIIENIGDIYPKKGEHKGNVKRITSAPDTIANVSGVVNDLVKNNAIATLSGSARDAAKALARKIFPEFGYINNSAKIVAGVIEVGGEAALNVFGKGLGLIRGPTENVISYATRLSKINITGESMKRVIRSAGKKIVRPAVAARTAESILEKSTTPMPTYAQAPADQAGSMPINVESGPAPEGMNKKIIKVHGNEQLNTFESNRDIINDVINEHINNYKKGDWVKINSMLKGILENGSVEETGTFAGKDGAYAEDSNSRTFGRKLQQRIGMPGPYDGKIGPNSLRALRKYMSGSRTA